jgi:hypothetical protein
MGNTQSTVRYLAPASFLFDFAAQQYGMFSKPNMLDIHNKNLAAFSPYPYAIAGFFFPQQLFQLAWLWKLWNQEGTSADRAMMNKFAWVYSLGNFCIGSTSQPLNSPSQCFQVNQVKIRIILTCLQHGCSSGTRTTSKPPTCSSS